MYLSLSLSLSLALSIYIYIYIYTSINTYRHYGSATKALWTMTEITFSGGWPGFTRKVYYHYY